MRRRTHRLAVSAVLSFAVLALETAERAEAKGTAPQIARSGSQLTVDWNSPATGAWTLADSSGTVCDHGVLAAGETHLAWTQLAAPTAVTLTFAPDGASPTSQEIAGQVKLSTLPKPQAAAVIYELPLRTYFATDNGKANSGTFNSLTAERLADLKGLGIDYLWLAGTSEHADRNQTDPDAVKGDAGSYYAIYDAWNVATELGTLADFDALVDRVHAAGLRVMIDLVPNHTARVHRTAVTCKAGLNFGSADQTGTFFNPANNYYYIQGSTFVPPPQSNNPGTDGQFDTDWGTPGIQLESPARVTGNDIVSATPGIDDWYETAKLNYGWDLSAKVGHYVPRPRTWDQMLDVAKYWVEHGVDGFRIDFAHPVPVEFWRFFAASLRQEQPNLFLMAEAYETDHRMALPDFSYYSLLDAGIDTIYESDLYWAMTAQVQRPGGMRSAVPSASPSLAAQIVQRGFLFTRFMENHDQVRLASHVFAPLLADREGRAALGLAYTAYLGLMPGHLLLHGGQEFQEDASVFGAYAGDSGHTSIFDYVYQSQTRTWLAGGASQAMTDFRARYASLLELKHEPAFAAAERADLSSLVDLASINSYADQSKWVASYLRHAGGDSYLVVTNSDPQVGHEATIHFTAQDNADTSGALAAMGVANDQTRYAFTEVFSRQGWVPTDPNVQGAGLPGWLLFRAGNVPSGLYLGVIPAATTYVFKVSVQPGA